MKKPFAFFSVPRDNSVAPKKSETKPNGDDVSETKTTKKPNQILTNPENGSCLFWETLTLELASSCYTFRVHKFKGASQNATD